METGKPPIDFRVLAQKKTSRDRWIDVQEFSGVAEAMEFCADMNELTKSSSYRVEVVTDPASIREMDRIKAEWEARYEMFLSAHIVPD